MVEPKDVLERLRSVAYPGFTRDIVSFGIVKDIEIGGLRTRVTLALPTADTGVAETIEGRVREIVEPLGLPPLEIAIEKAPPARASGGAPGSPPAKAPIAGVRHIVAVASGKGGVGKSTIASNLALALRLLGRRVGLLDADVYGPSVPTLLGLDERPTTDSERRILPLERFGVKAISIGVIVGEGKPIVWRGPMVTKLLNEFSRNVVWGDLDVLVLDLPPGTGDAQLTICQSLPLSGGVIVTTPSEVALLDVKRGITMFRDAGVPILGLVLNMASHVCRGCGRETKLFGTEGPERLAESWNLPVLGTIPLVREIREAGDRGEPIVSASPDRPEAKAFLDVARAIDARLEAEASPVSLAPRP